MSTNAILTQAEQFAQSYKFPTHEPQPIVQWGELDRDGRRPVHISFPVVYDPFYRWHRPFCRWDRPCSKEGEGQNVPDSKSKMKNELGLIIAITTILTIAFAYFLGQDLGHISAVNRKINELDAADASDPKIGKVVQIQKEMLQSINDSTKSGLALKGALFASMTTATMGAIAAAPLTTAAGLAGSLASAAALCVKKGSSDYDFTLVEKAEDLLEAVNLAKS
jgi:hypothetical protein